MVPFLSVRVWAQAGSGLGTPTSLVILVPRRWYSSLTLSSADAVPSLQPLWMFLGALGTLLLVSMAMQGPREALGQLFDLPGHLRLLGRSTIRLRQSSRLVGAIIGFTVLSWTAAQTLTFRMEQGREDLVLLRKSRGVTEFGLEQGVHGALTPFRDIAGLGDNLALLIVASVLLFRSMGEPQNQGSRHGKEGSEAMIFDGSAGSRPTRVFLLCGCTASYLIYRLVGRALGSVELPLGGCLTLEVVLIPAVMLVCDGFLLSWVLTELRDSEFTAGKDLESLGNVSHAVELTPAGMLTCVSLLPARYAATFALLSLDHLPPEFRGTEVGRYLRWQLGPGLAVLQAVGLVFAGLAAVAVWSRGTVWRLPSGWVRLITAEGGRIVASLATMGIAAGVFAAIPYLFLLLLPVQTWVLAAADSYSHYATLPVAFWGLAALIDLGRSALPVAPVAGAVHEAIESSSEAAAT